MTVQKRKEKSARLIRVLKKDSPCEYCEEMIPAGSGCVTCDGNKYHYECYKLAFQNNDEK